MRFSQRSSLRGRRYLPRGATPGSATAASVSGQLQNHLLQVGFLSLNKNVGLKLRVSPLISQTCYRAFQMQFLPGHHCPAKLYLSVNYIPDRLLGLALRLSVLDVILQIRPLSPLCTCNRCPGSSPDLLSSGFGRLKLPYFRLQLSERSLTIHGFGLGLLLFSSF